MTHYESQDAAKDKDSKAIDAILKLDEKALVDRVETLGISMATLYRKLASPSSEDEAEVVQRQAV